MPFIAMDYLAILAVSLQSTALAYVYQPKWKAFIWSLPVPFTMASLAMNRPVDATNVLGLVLLTAFAHAVRIFYQHARLPIVPSILLALGGYCLIGWQAAQIVPRSEAAFWISCVFALCVSAAVLKLFPARREPGHRSPLPVYLKLPAIIGVTTLAMFIKNGLQGFTSVFPMVGVIAAYETRNSLWTTCRQVPLFSFAMVPMMATVHLMQAPLGLPRALLVSWAVFFALMIPLNRLNTMPEPVPVPAEPIAEAVPQ